MSDKPKLITVSFGDCPVVKKCEGCYLETLKLNSSGEAFESIAKTLTEKDFIYFNINQASDIEKAYKYHWLADKVPSKVVIPLVIVIARDDLLHKINSIGGAIITINTFMDKGWLPVAMDYSDLIPFAGLKSIGIEVSTNSDIVKSQGHPNLLRAVTIVEKIASVRTNEVPLVFNYIPTDVNAPLKNVYKAFSHFTNINNVEARMSGCIESAVDKSEELMPCNTHNIKDYIDGYLKSEGCPWTVKTCQLSL